MHVEPPCKQGVASTDRTRGGPNERLTGDSIPRRVTPSRVQLAVSKPAQSSLFEPRLVRAPISAARHERTDLWRSISIKRLPQRKHQSLARDPWSCSGLRCALNTGSRPAFPTAFRLAGRSSPLLPQTQRIRAGAALQAMITDESLTVSEAVH